MESTGRGLKYPVGGDPFSIRVLGSGGRAWQALDLVPHHPVSYVPGYQVAARTGALAARVGASRFRKARRIVARLLIAFAILQVLDLVSTLALLSIGGIEVNPVSAWLLGYGVGTFVVAKLALAAALLACVPLLRREKKEAGLRTAMWTCAGFDAIYIIAVLSNLLQFAIFA